MADISLFRALRYGATRVDLQTVVVPPYDVLSEAEARAYRQSSPYNAIHLDMPADEEAAVGEDRYAHAAAEFARWQRERVLLRDGQPALYVLTQDFRGPDGVLRRRRGFIGRLGLGEPGSEVLRPHEATNSGPLRDRLALLRAGHANFSPIFALYADTQQPVWETLATAERPVPPLELRDRDGTTHILQPAVGPQAVAAAALLGGATLIIADGHHRAEAALAYREERRALGDRSADSVMAYFCGTQDSGLEIFPAHRLLRGIQLPSPELLRQRLAARFEIVAEAAGGLTDPSALLHRLRGQATAPHFALLLARERLTLIVRPRGEGAVRSLIDGGLSPELAALPVTILHHLLLPEVFGVAPQASEHLLAYTHRSEEVVERLRAGEYQLGIVLTGASVEDVLRVVAAGQTMPQKATYFFPKLLTGLLFNPLD